MLPAAILVVFVFLMMCSKIWVKPKEVIPSHDPAFEEFMDLCLQVHRYIGVDEIIGEDMEVSFWLRRETREKDKLLKSNWQVEGF